MLAYTIQIKTIFDTYLLLITFIINIKYYKSAN